MKTRNKIHLPEETRRAIRAQWHANRFMFRIKQAIEEEQRQYYDILENIKDLFSQGP